MIDNPVIAPHSDPSVGARLQLWLSDATTNAVPPDGPSPADRECPALIRTAQRRQEKLISRSMLRDCVAAGQHYSLSHSGGQAALLTTADSCAIGVDLEVHRPRDWLRKAELVFTSAEVAALRQAPAQRAETMFYALWTMKEALAKALQLELMQALTQCRFEPAGNDQWTGSAPTDQPWSVQAFSPHPGATLAVACVGARPTLQARYWTSNLAAGASLKWMSNSATPTIRAGA